MNHRLPVLGLAIAVATALPMSGGSARASESHVACPPDKGVTVVVDARSLGGALVSRCVLDGGGKTAEATMAEAGFRLAYVAGEPFVCRIDGRPGADAESCQRTPPADASWGLFWSPDRRGWTYSALGVTALKVPAGGSIGLRFQRSEQLTPPGARQATGSGSHTSAQTRLRHVSSADQPTSVTWVAIVVILALLALVVFVTRRTASS